ncbi:hypothetical protein [Eleftheria terrae]|uniref:hypothetical protein n=1 Tax=Eleftheria terrae TaxID=1597781 RepID=UPI00263B2626|nr:hypothetical protein [Eleftheria terrae]WKB51812.1 hypothetical protein N7L95_18690 [Eleftheria terrae]
MSITLTPGCYRGLRIAAADPRQPNGFEAAGLALNAESDGTLRACLDRLALRNLRLRLGSAALDITLASLKGAVVRLAPLRPGEPLELLGLRADEVQLQGLKLSVPAEPGQVGALAGPWRLDALGGMDGSLRAFVTDAAWVVDADVSVPVSEGQLDFNRVVVEHVGPNSSMGLSQGGLYVDAPNVGRIFLYVFTAGSVPGARFETRGAHVSDRGGLDLRALLQALLDDPQRQPLGKPVGRHEAALDRTRLSGELQVGDGALGTARHHLLLAGRAQRKNRIELSAGALGRQLVARVAEAFASEAVFDLLGLPGRTGPISADLEIHLTGLRRRPEDSTARAALLLSAGRVALSRLVLGEVGEATPTLQARGVTPPTAASA